MLFPGKIPTICQQTPNGDNTYGDVDPMSDSYPSFPDPLRFTAWENHLFMIHYKNQVAFGSIQIGGG